MMASREEHLCRAREEKEEQARRPDAILSASDAALQSRDVQPPTDRQEEHPEPRRVKEEDEDLTPCRVKEEEEEVGWLWMLLLQTGARPRWIRWNFRLPTCRPQTSNS
ncbi:uncharacterized protein ACBT44_007288 isoform 5-T5 [Syngnathus typhle]